MAVLVFMLVQLLMQNHLVSAATFHINCTLPLEEYSYVTAPSIRSTLSIFWSSIFTIFICTWTVQHLSVPPQDYVGVKGFVKSFWRKLKWMLVTLFMPELLLGRALGEFMAARESVSYDPTVKHSVKKSKKWTRTHAYYANMGGFVLREKDPPHSSPAPSTHASSLITELPSISEAEIKDKSKGDYMVKSIALFQVIWLVIQLATRLARGLPSAQLEVAALSFAVCTIITYVLWLEKPQDVRVPTYIYTARDLDAYDKGVLPTLNMFGFFENNFLLRGWRIPASTVPNDLYMMETKRWLGKTDGWNFTSEDVGYVFGAMVFGAGHCIAWDFEFPTQVEQTLWRVASVATAAVMPVYYFVWWLLRDGIDGNRVEKVLNISVGVVAAVVYVLGRLFLLAEMFRSLFHLPPEAFVGTWSMSIPHVS
ncbi:hypothetical protein BU16DRAFT_465657 [Lophium mytilinum]|uniref:Wax synthase domain-containing protein n=1 Tax=Lophium mytilinum TaxID=390894 RepID=A0A6A6QQJ1_9PEZI|nr:hypothetical protein BU16DRAFT_465657 [Lophium mytilinum]